MKYMFMVELDLTGEIPRPEDLKPHDYPQHAWAHQRVLDVFTDLTVHYLERIQESHLVEDPVMRKATQAAIGADFNLAQQLKKDFSLTPLDEPDLPGGG